MPQGLIPPSRSRRVPIVSTATMIFASHVAVRENKVVTSGSSTTVTLDTGASSVADEYNGLYFSFIAPHQHASVGQPEAPFLITDYSAADVVTLGSAMSAQPNTTVTFRVHPNLPPAWGQLMIGGTASTVHYSFEVDGANDATRRLNLGSGQFRTFNLADGFAFNYLEVRASAATDNLTIEWN